MIINYAASKQYNIHTTYNKALYNLFNTDIVGNVVVADDTKIWCCAKLHYLAIIKEYYIGKLLWAPGHSSYT